MGLFGISFGFWGIFCLFTALSIERFIVKRYEKETELLDTVFFKNHVPFARYLPNFFSSEIYTGHLMMCLWGWRYFRTRKAYKDIKESTLVTRHFTKKEINKVKRYAISLLILISHGIAYFIFRSIRPEVFN
jgi:hypothetical protein